MAAGLPGAGIGGLFYLASTAALAVRSAWRRLAGIPDTVSARALGVQLGIAAGIVGGIWGAGWLLGLVLPVDAATVAPAAQGHGTVAHHSVLRVATIAAGFVTLFVVLGAVELARLLTPRRRRYSLPAGESSPPQAL